ncbi:ABC transporter permease [Oceanivirga salmonicida]|uniref:ABC transporter permease n=1 Tax=Oceanivirga salmonicida TaxID=1769291 RepID=UPI001E3AAF32|nr:iron ABC transporter permease [Oceanivirga salmonicida]
MKKDKWFSIKIKDPLFLIAIIIIVISLLLFIILPMFQVFKQSIFDLSGNLTSEAYINAFKSDSNVRAIKNTLFLGTVVGILSTVVGFAFAYTNAYIKMRWKTFFNFITILPMVSPPFAISLSIIYLFGTRGLITRELFGIMDSNIYGLPGLILVQTLTFFPISYLVLNGVLKTIDPSVEEASENLGANKLNTFLKITLPLSRSAIANSFLLVFIKSIADFGNPIAIGGSFNTLAVMVYQQALGNYDLAGAAALAIILLDISLVLFVLSKYYFDTKSYVTVTGKTAKHRSMIRNLPLNVICTIIASFIILLYILIPVGSFVKLWGVNYSLTLEHYVYALAVGKKAIFDTTIFSIIAAPITGVLGMLIAYIIVRKKFFGKGFIEFTSMLGIAVPGTVIGIGYILAFNTPPIVLTGTATILIITFIARSIPIGIKSGVSTLQQIDPSIEEAATDLGANSFKVFFTITLPMLKQAFLGGMVYSFIKSMTSLSAVIFLISARYNLITISVLDQVEVGKYGVASAFSTILICIVYTAIFIMEKGISLSSGKKEKINLS